MRAYGNKVLKIILFLIIVLIVILVFRYFERQAAETHPSQAQNSSSTIQTQISSSTLMLLTSPAFKNNDAIPNKFTCDGGNINPQLAIGNLPAETKSLA